MITKLYKAISTGTTVGLLVAMMAVAPVSAQSMPGQNPSQASVSCASFAQSLGQGLNANVQATLGTGTANAATPTNCWLSVGPGQKEWYKFHAGARATSSNSSNSTSNSASNNVDDSDAAVVQLAMDTPGCVTFEVWTLARLNAPPPVDSATATREEKRKDKEVARGPVGVGSPEFAIVNDNTESSNSSNKNSSSASSDKNRDLARLIWRGGSTGAENFYIAVRNVRTDFACTYRLSVSGPIVSFPSTSTTSNPGQ